MDECNGCKYEESTDIKIHMQYCLHCKRGYLAEEARDLHDDLFEAKEGEE